MSRVQLLRTHGVEPIIVFDGGRLPIKGEEEETRHRLVLTSTLLTLMADNNSIMMFKAF